MTLNEHVSRALSALVITAGLGGAAWIGTAIGHADPQGMINLTDVQDIDSLPVCAEEDCSDQPGQVGVWMDKDTGNWYLSLSDDEWYLINDDTVTVDHGSAAADGAVPGPSDYLTDDIGYDAGYEN